jgi:hypothetical protein
MTARPWIWSLALLLAAGVGAQELYVPAVAHTSGVGGTEWRTDLEVKARGDAPATFSVDLLQEGADNSAPLTATFTVGAGQSRRFEDLVQAVFGVTGNGALRITPSDGSVLVTSRTYNDDPGGTYGQYVPALPASAATADGTDVALIQLSRSASGATGYRTNVGFLSLTGSDMEVEVDLLAASGDLLGSRTFTLLPYEHRQVTDVFALVTDQDVADGYALVRTRTSGARFLAYASVVDNRSGDAVFIPAQEEGPSQPPERLVVFESFMRHG